MFCNKCGKEIDNNVRFCPYCGAEASSANGTIQSYGNSTKTVNIANEQRKGIASTIHSKELIIVGGVLLAFVIIVILVGLTQKQNSIAGTYIEASSDGTMFIDADGTWNFTIDTWFSTEYFAGNYKKSGDEYTLTTDEEDYILHIKKEDDGTLRAEDTDGNVYYFYKTEE